MLQNNVTSNGTCFSVQADNITLNLNGHTVVYGNGPYIPVANGSFESGSVDWNLSGAPAASVITGTYTNPVQVKDGTHSLQISLPASSSQTIVNTQPIVIPAHRTYVASALFADNVSDGLNDNISHTIELLDATTGAVVASQTETGMTWRSFEYVGAFYTPTQTSTVKIAIVVAGNTSVMSGDTYVDEVALNQGPSHGVMAGAGWSPDGYGHLSINSDSDLISGGSANNFTVTNGTITQGVGNGLDSGAIFFYQVSGNNATVSYTTSTVYGPDSKNVYFEYQGGDNINNNTFYNNVTVDSNRDEQYGDSVKLDNTSGGNLVWDNTVIGGDQLGINIAAISGASSTEVYGNVVKQDASYTNDFGIQGGNGVEDYGNIVEPVSGRGIFLGDDSSDGDAMSVHNNTVIVEELSQNQEYNGCEGGGTYGLQWDNNPANAVAYDNNVTALAGPCDASGLRITDSETSTNVSYNNTYTAKLLPGSTANAYGASIAGPTAFTSRNDTFTADTANIDAEGGSNVMFYNPTFIKGSNASPNYVTFNFYSYDSPMTNLHFIDPTFENGASATSYHMLKIGEWEGYSYMEYFIDYTYTLTVENSSGVPIPGAAVAITNALGKQVFSGYTNANGVASTTLTDLHVFNSTSSITQEVDTPDTVAISANGYTAKNFSVTMTQTTNQTQQLSGTGTGNGSSGTPPDTTPPSSPTNLLISGVTPSTITLSWSPSTDNVGVTGYTIYRNGNQIGASSGAIFTDSNLSPSTSYTYTVVAYDAAGNISTGASVTGTTASASITDASAPIVAITTPLENATVSGDIRVTVSASDNAGVTKVELYANGILAGTDTLAPYTFSYDTTNVADGSYSLQAKAYDVAGNAGTSPTITINVANATLIVNPTSTTSSGGSSSQQSSSFNGGGSNNNSSNNSANHSGGSAVGSGGGIYTPPPVTSPPALAPSSTTTTPSNPSDFSPATYFPNSLSYGDYGAKVELLQSLLQQLGFFPATIVPTGYFGAITQHALLLFQGAHLLDASGAVDGPSQALLNKVANVVFGSGSTPSNNTMGTGVVSPSSTTPSSGSTFFRYLEPGARGADVIALQKLLFKDGDYPRDLITGFFGPLTEAAVRTFQAKYGIVNYGSISTTGYGGVGPKTRERLNVLEASGG